MRISTYAVMLGFFLDLLMGDPRWLYHPVRLIGKYIEVGERIIRSFFPESPLGERLGGGCLVVLVLLFGAGAPTLLLYILYRCFWPAAFVLESFWCYQLLATKSLKDESMKVYEELKKPDLPLARKAVSMIVGRDTQNLNEEGVCKAAVETVAENASDGVVAPLFYMMIGGAAFGFLYKAINTMDSMIGYQNDCYRYFGTVAARLDDLANFIPARLSAVFMILAAKCCGMNVRQAWKIFLRDRKKHASPNAANTEAVMAGALEVQLAGDAWYFGVLHKKEYIGDPIRRITPYDIIRANRLLYGTAVLAFALLLALRLLLLQMLIF